MGVLLALLPPPIAAGRRVGGAPVTQAAAVRAPAAQPRVAGAPVPGLAPLELAVRLAELGPREPGSAAHRQAVELLLEAMTAAGLSAVAALPAAGGDGLTALSGVLTGSSEREIVLSAHFDTVAGSPGAGDDASGCAVVVAAAAELAPAPLGHTVRVLIFDREESGLAGSREWVAALEPVARQRILADLNLEMVGWPGSGGAVLHTFPVRRGDAWRLTPGWLVHGALRGAEAAAWPLAVVDPLLSWFGQLALRAARPTHAADSDSFLAAGIPSILFSDSSLSSFDPAYHRAGDAAGRLDGERLERWTRALAAIVRRLDALPARPAAEDAYLATAGRVWPRRDLYWAGFLLWAVLVWRGRPGRWRAASADERRRRGRAYLPGFVFRMVFLAAVLATPVFAAALLFPAGLFALVPPSGRWRRRVVVGAALPAVLFAAGLLVASLQGRAIPTGAALLPAATVLATLAAFTWWALALPDAAAAAEPVPE